MRAAVVCVILNMVFYLPGVANGSDTIRYTYSRQSNGDTKYAQLERGGQKWKLGNEKKIANRTVARKIIAPSGTYTFGYNSKTKTDSLLNEEGDLLALISYDGSSLFAVKIPGGSTFQLKQETDKKWKYYIDNALVLDCILKKKKGENNYIFEFIQINEDIDPRDLETVILMAQIYGVNRIVTMQKRPIFFAALGVGVMLGIASRSIDSN